MSDPTRQQFPLSKLRPFARFVRKNATNGLFHAMNLFRRTAGDRNEVRINGKTVIYDIFPCKSGRYIAVTAYYGRLGNFKAITCTFQSGDVATAEWIDDSPHAWEGEQILIGLFPVPEADKHAGKTSICLRSPQTTLTKGLAIDLAKHEKAKTLSVATMMKDEDPFLKEWIEYYRLLGAGHFYIYDNKSMRRNKVRSILRPYIQQGLVTLVDWDYPYAVDATNTWRFCQRGQMHHCLYKYGHLSKWMLFIDVDEFIYPIDAGQISLLPLLKSHDDKPEVAALQFKMMWFGSFGLEKVPPGLLIEHCTHRAADVFPQGREKCCVKSDKVELLYIHDVKQCIEGSRMITVSPQEYRINHYYATSSTRRRRVENRFNDVQDLGMHKFVPQLRRNMLNK